MYNYVNMSINVAGFKLFQDCNSSLATQCVYYFSIFPLIDDSISKHPVPKLNVMKSGLVTEVMEFYPAILQETLRCI